MEDGVIGLDFGSLSCRGLLAGTDGGRILAEEVFPYRHGIMEFLPNGKKIPGGYVLQDPEDFREALFEVIRRLLSAPQAQSVRVTAIGLDTTASTVIPVLSSLKALSSSPAFRNHPDAYAIMWKDHRAAAEADMITKALWQTDPDWLGQFGGSIGAEALISKVLHLCLHAQEIYDASYAFMEMGDWLTSLLTGQPTISKTTLTCKNLYRNGIGFPEDTFFEKIDRRLTGVPAKIFPWDTHEASLGYPGQNAGRLSKAAAQELGLDETTVVTFAQMDGYAGLVGAGISEQGQLVLTLGTSTGFFLLCSLHKSVEGVCAAVRDSMVPGYTGIAAGQASTGDSFAWFVNNAVPEAYWRDAEKYGMDIHSWLCECIRHLPENTPHLLSVDWMNGNKSPMNRSDLTGLILGITLETKTEEIYRAMMETTAFGARRIIENLEQQGIPINRIIAVGGISNKNAMLMQIYADVLQKPIEVSQCGQTAALGSSIAAAVAKSEGYSRWSDTVSGMKPTDTMAFFPDVLKKTLYDRLYHEYLRITDYFANQNPVMAELRGIR